MRASREGGRAGCGYGLAIAVSSIWLAVAVVGSALLVDRSLAGLVTSAAADGLTVASAALALLAPSFAVSLLARRRAGLQRLAAIAAGLAIAGGYIVLDAAARTVLPQGGILTPLGRRYASAALQLVVLVPYALLAARLAPRLAGIGSGSIQSWLGLEHARWPAILVALAASALVTLSWPVTGALGDSLTSLSLAVQVTVSVVARQLLFWGVVYHLLSDTLARQRPAAVATIALFSVSAVAGFLPEADWTTVLGTALLLVPLGFLLAEMRVRGRAIFPLLPLAWCYRLVPTLFVDPRDAIAQGIPELQHILSYLIAALVATVVAVVLLLGRRALVRRPGKGDPTRARAALPLVVAVVAWGIWGGAYLLAGEPGFSNDGLLVVFAEQGDLSPAYQIPDRHSRRAYVYETLVETAERTQVSVRRELDGLGVRYRPYYIINMIRVDGHRWLRKWLEGRPGVAEVILNPNVRKYARRIPMPYGSDSGPPEGVQENLATIRADAAWDLGILGEGIVVGGQDTGYQWNHPALRSQYRGWRAGEVDHDYNWHDAWDHTTVPWDDGSHGTHTMGIVLGDDGAQNRVGVAPQAHWIGCRNMRRGLGNPGSYAECMEFLLAPFPPGADALEAGDVRLAPDVVNNSWGCPRMEGCLLETLGPAVAALRAAGTMMVVSAGNDGPACGTAATPPANYDASFTVGATTEEGDVVSFSSRGPVGQLVKPDIAAPGLSVRSSVPGGYGLADGTSMAAPHVAGTVALVWSAASTLIGDVEETEELLCRTAVPKPVDQLCVEGLDLERPLTALGSPPPCACGGLTGVPNHVYGCGAIDAGAAVQAALEKQSSRQYSWRKRLSAFSTARSNSSPKAAIWMSMNTRSSGQRSSGSRSSSRKTCITSCS